MLRTVYVERKNSHRWLIKSDKEKVLYRKHTLRECLSLLNDFGYQMQDRQGSVYTFSVSPVAVYGGVR